jgi:hypothetical protein
MNALHKEALITAIIQLVIGVLCFCFGIAELATTRHVTLPAILYIGICTGILVSTGYHYY